MFVGVFIFGFFVSWFVRDYYLIDIIPLFDNQYAPKVISLINNAKKSIHIVMFEMKFYENNNLAKKLLNALIGARYRGVEVKVLIEGGDYWNNLSAIHNKTFEYLSYYNVSVKFDEQGKTTHAKFIVIDSEIIILGSTNWAYYSLSKNHEVNVIIKDPILAWKFEQYFNQLWEVNDF